MNFKNFTSQNRTFSLTLPIDWEEYDDEEENTYAFFNSKSWTGNFRITHFRRTEPSDSKEDKAAQYILEEIDKNQGANKITLGDFDCAHYKREVIQEGDELLLYYWITGKRNNIFICSFTIDKKQEQTSQNEEAVESVQNIIESIILN